MEKRSALGLLFLFCATLGYGKSEEVNFTQEILVLPGKKGACFTLRQEGSKKGGTVRENMPKVKALDVSWNYSWGTTYVEQQPTDIEFIPMTWGALSSDRFQERLDVEVIPMIKAGKVKRLLTFNEPDKKDQSNLPYTKALELWPQLEKLGIPLCSPACANPEGINDPSSQGVPGTWMSDFMKGVEEKGFRVDYIGVHWYGGTDSGSFKAKLKRIYEKYGKRPLLITEFAPADWKTKGDIKQHRHTPAKVLKFMKEVLPWMEKQDWIAGYAWFSFKIDTAQGTSSALFDLDGRLTDCGQFYKSVHPENPEGDQTIRVETPLQKLD